MNSVLCFGPRCEPRIAQVRLSAKRTAKLEAFLHTIKRELDNTPTRSASDADLTAALACIPRAEMKNAKAVGMKLQAPAGVAVIGSFLIKTAAMPRAEADLAVTIPTSSLLDKDYFNKRYLVKRLMFLRHLASTLSASDAIGSVRFAPFHSNTEKPVLIVEPPASPTAEQHSISIAVRIFVHLPEGLFAPNKLSPARNNLPALSRAGEKTAPSVLDTAPTTAYNNSIVEDMFFNEHHVALFEATRALPALIDAILLFNVWLRQRSADGPAADALSGFQLSMLLLHLQQQRKLSVHLSSYHIFRLGLQLLAEPSLPKKAQAMAPRAGAAAPPDWLALFAKTAGGPVLLDGSGRLNLLAGVGAAALAELGAEAARTLEYLNDPAEDSFSLVFLTRVPFRTKYDVFVSIRDAPEHWYWAEDDSVAIGGGNEPPMSLAKALALVERGLGDRVHAVRCLKPRAEPWRIDGMPVANGGVTIGLSLNADNAFRTVDRGPAADDAPRAGDFQRLWGDRSEVRRFKDGSIVHAVVWDTTGRGKGALPWLITRHLLHLHAGVDPNAVEFIGDQADRPGASKRRRTKRGFSLNFCTSALRLFRF